MNKNLTMEVLTMNKNLTMAVLLGFVFASCERPKPFAVGRTLASDGSVASIQSIHDTQAVDGDTITVPAGSFPWTTTVIITKSITLQGAGAISSVSGGGSTTGSDVTTIVDHYPTTEHKLIGFQLPAGKTARLTGFEFANDASTVNTQAGMIQVSGGSNCIRIDHNHFHYPVSTPGAPSTISTYDGVTGVIDHNYFEQELGNGPVGIYLQNGVRPGDTAWSAPDDFGTDKFIFIEDNRWRNGYPGDANTGGQRFVYRYNTFVMEFDDSMRISQGYVSNHGITSGRGRSSRADEYYKNNVSAKAPGLNYAPWGFNGGTGMVWGNTISQYRFVVSIGYTRKNNGTYPYGTPPNGWGNCDGTTGTVWDGPGGGYPCLDQPGRGQGDLLSGNFPNIINTRTGNAAQVIQKLSPIYIWGNTFNPANYSPVPVVSNQVPVIVQPNRDFYQQFGPNGESGSFDGTRGVGEGLLSSRPSTCTAGVGYWATDKQTLYTCGSANNSWLTYYTPFTYPHPLATGGPSATPAPSATPGGNVITAASTSAADVSAAISQAQDGYTVKIPAGTSTWTTQVWIGKAITLQGAGIGQTIIKDGANGTQFLAARLVAGKVTRFTGMEFQNGGRTQVGAAPAGCMKIYGADDGSQWRMDNCKWDNLNGYLVTDTVVGVIDHNNLQIGGPVYEWMYPYGNTWGGKTYGDGSWEMPANFGSSKFLFIEDNTATCSRTTLNCSLTDGFNGARFVVRHNKLNNFNVGDHGTESPGRGRSSRAKEIYANDMDGLNANKYPIGTRGGVVLVHDNTIKGYYAQLAQNNLASYRMVEDFSPWGGANGENPWDRNNAGNPFTTLTATAVNRRVVTANATWSPNQWAGYTLHRTAGANTDFAYIDSNTANTITYRSGGYGRDMVAAVGDTFEINKVDQSLDQPGTGTSSAISGDNPTPPPNFSQGVEACYAWNNTNEGQPWNTFNPSTTNIKSGVHFFNNTKMPGYTEFTYPHPLVSGGGVSPSPAPTSTAIPTATATATILPTVTPQPTATATATAAPTSAPPTPTPNVSPTQTPTSTATATSTPTATVAATATPTATAVASPTVAPTAGGTPSAPTNLTAKVVRGKDVQLFWSDNSNNELSFEIARVEVDANTTCVAGSGETIGVMPQDTTTFIDTGSDKKHSYCYSVRAMGPDNTKSPWSNVVKITP